MYWKYCIICLLLMPIGLAAQKQFRLNSPNNKIAVEIDINLELQYAIFHDGDELISKSPIAVMLENGMSFGIAPKLQKYDKRHVDNKIYPPVYKKKEITDCYNELNLRFKGNYAVVFRAYDDGVAYRFVYTGKDPVIVNEERVQFNLPADNTVYLPYVKPREKDGTLNAQFYSAFQNLYVHIPVSQWDKKRLAFAPVLIDGANNKKICVTEADLMDYPGMYLSNFDGSTTIKGVFPPYPKTVVQAVRGLKGEVKERESYIAKLQGNASLPWRALIIAEQDKELLDNDLIYKLATPAYESDYSWIKPGKVAWDWWNNWNLSQVDFETGINNDTYKYYIDFASRNGIEYVILDEGWSVYGKADLYQVVPEINLEELIAYAAARNVGIILWAGYFAFDKDMEGICRHYAKMGVKGFKLDFMDRDDQLMVDFHRRAAEIAGKYKLMIDFHGTYKPTGLQRTYPNVVNFEGVHGSEEMKWMADTTNQVEYDVTVPFIRMVAGPIDYTQGAMKNANKTNYRSIYYEPMSQGTRCRQLALYVVLESPLNMLCDSPTNYLKEQESTSFIAGIPTVWDETIALDGKIGEYVSIARRSGSVWYVAALTNWDERELELDLSFLPGDGYRLDIFQDGVNADKVATDYARKHISLPADKKLRVKLASGGGFIAKIE